VHSGVSDAITMGGDGRPISAKDVKRSTDQAKG
jgi:hypothetical protein